MPYIFTVLFTVLWLGYLVVVLVVAYYIPTLWRVPATNRDERFWKSVFIIMAIALATSMGVLSMSALTTTFGWYAPHSGFAWLIVLIGGAFMTISLQARKEHAAKVAEGLSAEDRILHAGHIAGACSCLGWLIALLGASWLMQSV